MITIEEYAMAKKRRGRGRPSARVRSGKGRSKTPDE